MYTTIDTTLHCLCFQSSSAAEGDGKLEKVKKRKISKVKSEPENDLPHSDNASVDSGVIDTEVGVVTFSSSPEPDVATTEQLPAVKKEPKLGKLSKFRINESMRKLLKERGVKELFPIQYLTFDHVYDGKDVIGQARTGTGKTLSFVLPLVEKLQAEDSLSKLRGRPPTVLVMVPTRELANQVYSEVCALAPEGMTSHCIYGGAPYSPQENAIRRGLDLLVGTPGRILDLMTRGTLDLGQLRYVWMIHVYMHVHVHGQLRYV